MYRSSSLKPLFPRQNPAQISNLKEYPGINDTKLNPYTNNSMNTAAQDKNLNWQVEDDIKRMRFKKLKGGRKEFANVRNPCNGYCSRCKASAVTITSLECTSRQWCYCSMLTITGCLWFSCVPFVFNDCYNIRHNCSTCGKYLGCSL